MGMAASQARFLSLTARKSNVEYEGQQVNQQRTALANESANLYNRLTSIKIPTPPATSDYYETVYTFTTSELDTSSQTGSTSYTLNNIYTTPDGLYANLSYNAYEWQAAVSSAYRGEINNVYDDMGNIKGYKVSLANGTVTDAVKYSFEPSQTNVTLDITDNKVQLGNIDFDLTQDGKKIIHKEGDTIKYEYDVTKNDDGTYTLVLKVEKPVEDPTKYVVNCAGGQYEVTLDPSTGVYSCEPIEGTQKEEVAGKYVDDQGRANSAVSYFDDDFKEAGGLQNQPVLAYVIGNQTYFISAAEFKRGDFSGSSYVHSVAIPKKVDYPCSYSTAATGRYKTVTITDEYGISHTFDLDVKTLQDEEAYAQAMLDYEYQQAKYQKEVQDINAKTEALQKEDRTLELRLKQLDTEQNAIKTEMDAVSKVIEDNIEATFKTFA